MTLVTIQQEGLLDPCVSDVVPEIVYCLIAVQDYNEYVEGVFVTEDRAKRRKDVLAAEQALRTAKWREEHGTCECGSDSCTYHSGIEETWWCIRATRLFR